MQKLLLLVGLCVLVAQPEATDSRKLVCTFQSVPTFDVASDMEAQPCTHIIFKSVQPSRTTMEIPSSGGPIPDHRVFKTIQNATAKTLLEVDLTQTSSNIFTTSNRATFITSVVAVVDAEGFDGVDIVWMKSGSSHSADKWGFTHLMQELKAELGKRLLTASVSGESSVIDNSYEVPLLDGVVDFFNVLTADLDRTSTPGTFPNAKDGMQKFVTEGATKAKLNMGIATYGYDTNPNASPRILPKSQVCAAVAPVPSATVVIDSDATIEAKAQYVMAQQFGGAYVTSLQLDDFDGVCNEGTFPVIRLIKAKI